MKILLFLWFSFWSFSDCDIGNEIKAIHGKAKTHLKTNLDSAFILVRLALEKSKEAGYLSGEAKSHWLLGDLYKRRGRIASATPHYLDALFLYDAIDDPQYLAHQANIHIALGKLCRQYNKNQEAIEYYNRGLKLAYKANDDKVLIRLLHNSAIAHRYEGAYDIAIDLLRQKLTLIGPNRNADKLRTFNTLGTTYYLQKQYDKSKAWFTKMLVNEADTALSYYRGQACHNLANVYIDEGNYTTAWMFYKKALAEKKHLGNVRSLFLTYQDMAELALLQNQPEVALTYAQKATPLLDQLPDTREYFDQYELLSRCFKTSDPQQAWHYKEVYISKLDSFHVARDEIMQQLKGHEIDLITANYYSELRIKQLAEQVYWLVIVMLVSVLGFAGHRLWKVYGYRSPRSTLSMIQNRKEMIFLIDVLRNKNEEFKNTIRDLDKN